MVALPMFPLGTVLMPTGALPLTVFEPRYQALVHDCLRGDRAFGVVLIARGSEVGGGDVRTDVGTEATIVDAAPVAEGRWLIGTVGVRRFRVTSWLPDDPYPRAEIEYWPDPPPGPDHATHLVEVAQRLRQALALAIELGDAHPAALDALEAVEALDRETDPTPRGYAMASLAPISLHDRQQLLAAPTPDDRLTMLAAALDDVTELLRFRMSS